MVKSKSDGNIEITVAYGKKYQNFQLQQIGLLFVSLKK